MLCTMLRFGLFVDIVTVACVQHSVFCSCQKTTNQSIVHNMKKSRAILFQDNNKSLQNKCPFQDVYITGFVARRCKIAKVNIPGFYIGKKPLEEIKPHEDILIHYIKHNEKFDIHKLMTQKLE